MAVNDLFNGMPDSWRFVAVLAGILSLGFTAGKSVADYTFNKQQSASNNQQTVTIVNELQKLNQIETEGVCLTIAQLRKTDWTACLLNDHY